MVGHEIPLDKAIELMDAQVGELGVVTGVCLYASDIRDYLIEYRELLKRTSLHKLLDVFSEIRGDERHE